MVKVRRVKVEPFAINDFSLDLIFMVKEGIKFTTDSPSIFKSSCSWPKQGEPTRLPSKCFLTRPKVGGSGKVGHLTPEKTFCLKLFLKNHVKGYLWSIVARKAYQNLLLPCKWADIRQVASVQDLGKCKSPCCFQALDLRSSCATAEKFLLEE